jgi:diketogulonate reductase-like aldo/keto reductase
MTERTWQIDGVAVPTLLYGTAWKEQRTATLVAQALRIGFRGLDTANQRRHYREAEVGRALLAELQTGTLRREDVFVQTKFTFRGGARIAGCPTTRLHLLRARFNNLSIVRYHTSV